MIMTRGISQIDVRELRYSRDERHRTYSVCERIGWRDVSGSLADASPQSGVERLAGWFRNNHFALGE